MTQTSDGALSPGSDTAAPPPSIFQEQRFPNIRLAAMRAADGTPSFVVPASEIVETVRFLREEGGYRLFEDLTALDWLPREPRFEVVYHFMNIEASQPIRLRVEVSGLDPQLPSITGVFQGANWYEREVFDLFGITFTGHPDLRRIQMPVDWEGYPLRKDYPITGPRRPNLPSNQLRLEGRNGAPQL